MIDGATEQDLYQQYPDLERLARVLRRSEGVFSLFFAECNLPVLRQELTSELSKTTKSIPIKVNLSELDLDTGSETIDEVIARQIEDAPKYSAVFLFGLEQLLPTLSTDKLRATVQQLNWRRSNLARLQRPLVIWLPRYALDLLAEQTPDFYDWYSGIYSFPVQAEYREEVEQNALQGLHSEAGVHAADHMSGNEKKRWLGTLKELLHEHPAQDKQRANLLYNMGYLLKSMGDYERSLDCYQQSLTIQQEIGDKSGEGTTLNNMAANAHARGDYEAALNYLKQSLVIQHETDDKYGEGVALNNISQVYYEQGDYEAALRYLKQSLAIQQEIGDKHGEGSTLSNLSQIFKVKGNYEAALKYLEQSLVIQQDIGNRAGEGSTLNNLSQIFNTLGDHETALNYLQKSLSIRQEIGDKSGEGGTLNNLSLIYDARGDHETALDFLKKSLAIQRQVGDKSGESAAMFNLGHMYWRNRDKKSAMQYWIDTYEIAKAIGDAKALDSLESLAKQLGLKGGLSAWEKPTVKSALTKK